MTWLGPPPPSDDLARLNTRSAVSSWPAASASGPSFVLWTTSDVSGRGAPGRRPCRRRGPGCAASRLPARRRLRLGVVPRLPAGPRRHHRRAPTPGGASRACTAGSRRWTAAACGSGAIWPSWPATCCSARRCGCCTSWTCPTTVPPGAAAVLARRLHHRLRPGDRRLPVPRPARPRSARRRSCRQYHWKTAAYTFEGPMLSGALLAGLGEPAGGPCPPSPCALGQAYQLQNDLVDLGGAAHEGCDLVQGKRTVTLLRARSAMPDGQRAQLRPPTGRACGPPTARPCGIAEELAAGDARRRRRRPDARADRRFLSDARAPPPTPPCRRRWRGDGRTAGFARCEYFLSPTSSAVLTKLSSRPLSRYSGRGLG